MTTILPPEGTAAACPSFSELPPPVQKVERERRLPLVSQETLRSLPTPCFLVEEGYLLENLKLLSSLQEEGLCKILLAQKAYSLYQTYPLIARYLSGTTASGLYEAKLASEYLPQGEIHVFSPAYQRKDLEEMLPFLHHLVFNSLSQWEQHATWLKEQKPSLSLGLRINPECSTQDHALYDPCASGSRFGVKAAELKHFLAHSPSAQTFLAQLDGLHFHTLCEQNSDALQLTWEKVKQNFAPLLTHCKWLNMGGGHHISKPGYDIDTLKAILRDAKQSFDLAIYLEPGEAVALDAGFLLASVIDVVENDHNIAVLDCSPTCHMPDVLEMPYRPRAFPLYPAHKHSPLPFGTLSPDPKLLSAEEQATCYSFDFRLAGPSCLAGDVIADYLVPLPLEAGDRLIFCDMAIYSMVKTNTFNGMPLPSIYVHRLSGELECVRSFSYEDFKSRL